MINEKVRLHIQNARVDITDVRDFFTTKKINSTRKSHYLYLDFKDIQPLLRDVLVSIPELGTYTESDKSDEQPESPTSKIKEV